MNETHIPVLVEAVVEALLPAGKPVERVVDGTLGAAGHTRALLQAGARQVLGLDRDPFALALARVNLAEYEARVHIVHASYVTMADEAARVGWDAVDAILLDLGVSSIQLDQPERGFAFKHDGPLDMRFDPGSDLAPASELVNHWDEADLARIFFEYGEERYSRRLASAVVRGRPYNTTGQLAATIERAVPGPLHAGRDHKRIHPATRIFQALRIAVNHELEAVEQALPIAIKLLKPGGRLAVISFHSLEDRIVKQTFKTMSTDLISPPGMKLKERRAVLRLVNRKPIAADRAEMERNPRSRSAKLRIAEKL